MRFKRMYGVYFYMRFKRMYGQYLYMRLKRMYSVYLYMHLKRMYNYIFFNIIFILHMPYATCITSCHYFNKQYSSYYVGLQNNESAPLKVAFQIQGY